MYQQWASNGMGTNIENGVIMMYMIHDGKRGRNVKGFANARDAAREWSTECNDVITLLRGGKSYSHFYHGVEISSKRAELIWKRELYSDVM